MRTSAFAILAFLVVAGSAQEQSSRRLATTLTSAEQTAIVARHNSLRATRNADKQPCSAADMETMVWDDTLATESQAYADGCVGDHASGAGSSFGENLWMSFPGTTYTQADIVGGVQSWYDEIVDTVWNIGDTKVTSKPKDQCVDVSGDTCNVGHYFQVIWAKSKKIGCGVKACTSSFTASGTSYGGGVLLVCRYDVPASLGAGETNSLPYIFGTPCATCAGGCSSSPSGLCNTAPTRCLDKLSASNTITIDKVYTDCSALVAAYPSTNPTPWCTTLASAMSEADLCALSCGACTVPSGVGSNHCSGGSTGGGGTTASMITTTAATTHHTSNANGAATTTVAATTTTAIQTQVTAKYSGKLVITMSGVSKLVMESAMVKALAAQFALMESEVSVTATESRRLAETSERRLANKWAIDFTLTAPTAKVSSIETKITALKSSTASLKSALSTELQSAGVDIAANTLAVESFSATAVSATGSASAAGSIAVDRMVFAMTIGALLWGRHAN